MSSEVLEIPERPRTHESSQDLVRIPMHSTPRSFKDPGGAFGKVTPAPGLSDRMDDLAKPGVISINRSPEQRRQKASHVAEMNEMMDNNRIINDADVRKGGKVPGMPTVGLVAPGIVDDNSGRGGRMRLKDSPQIHERFAGSEFFLQRQETFGKAGVIGHHESRRGIEGMNLVHLEHNAEQDGGKAPTGIANRDDTSDVLRLNDFP